MSLENIANKETGLAVREKLNQMFSELYEKMANVIRDQGNYDASINEFPSSGGSGTEGIIKKGNQWRISVAGTLGTISVSVGQFVRALVDNPGQTASNWYISPILQSGIVAGGATLIVPSRCNFSVMSYLGGFGLYVNSDSRTVVLGGIGVPEPYPRLDIEETYLILKGGQNALDFNFTINRYDTNNGDAIITDGRVAPKGLQEAADYSANKTDYCYATKKMISKPDLKSGATQVDAGASAGELWVDTANGNVVKMGV